MNVFKAMVFSAAALFGTTALAHDGSERASPAAQKIRIAQDARSEDPRSDKASRYVQASDKALEGRAKKI